MPRLGQKMTEAHKENIRIAHTGKKRTQAHRENMRKSRLGEKCYAWKGGKTKTGPGYILVKRYDHPNGFNHNYVREHRHVVEKQIGRLLARREVVHHIGEKADNRPHMLMAFVSQNAHKRFEWAGIVKPEEIIFDGRKLKH